MKIDAKKIVKFLQGARKFLAALTAAVAVAISVVADGEVSLNDVIAIGSALVGAGAVYQVTNKK